MRKLLRISAIWLTAVLLCGCHNELESEIDNLNRRIENLKQKCALLNHNIEGLQSIIDKINSYDFVDDATPITLAGKVIGYSISFTNSRNINLFFGDDGDTPILGVKLDSDGVYYWTSKYSDGVESYIYNDYAQKMSATSVTPLIEIHDGNWWISYDNGEKWTDLGKAAGNSGTSFFKSVTDNTDYVIFSLIDGTVINIPTWVAYQEILKSLETTNTNLESFQLLLKKVRQKVYVEKLGKYSDDSGIAVILSDGTILKFLNATATKVPQFSAAQDASTPSDTARYWQVKYPGSDTCQWILCNGEKVRADAPISKTPVIGCEKDSTNIYFWTVSYDGGESYEWILKDGEKVKAVVKGTSNPVSSVVSDIDGRYLKVTVNGQEVIIPQFKDIEVNVPTTVSMGASSQYTIEYEIQDADEQYAIIAVPSSDSFTVSVDRTDFSRGTITISSPDTFLSGTSTVTIVVSDGRGTIKTVRININYEG